MATYSEIVETDATCDSLLTDCQIYIDELISYITGADILIDFQTYVEYLLSSIAGADILTDFQTYIDIPITVITTELLTVENQFAAAAILNYLLTIPSNIDCSIKIPDEILSKLKIPDHIDYILKTGGA